MGILILQLAVGLQTVAIGFLINMHALSYQPYNKM